MLKIQTLKRKTGLIILSILIVSAMLVLSSCNSSNEKSKGDSKSIKVLLSEEPGEHDSFGKSLEKWEEKTGSKVEIIVIPYDDQLIKFPSMAKNKDLPDLIVTTRLHQKYPDEFIDLSKEDDTSKFESTALKVIGQADNSDKITGFPYQYTITNMYYNKDVFDEAGLEAPTIDNPWSWDEVYKNAELLQKKGAVKYGLAVDFSRARYDTLMYANGGSIVEKKDESFIITVTGNETVSTLEKFAEMNNKAMPKAIWAGGTNDNPADYFKNGNVGMYLSGSWNYNDFSTNIDSFKFAVMPTPKGSSSSSAIIGGTGLTVPKNAENKELAIEFIKWMFEEENYQYFLDNEKGLSALNDVLYEPANEEAEADFKVLLSEVDSVTESFMTDKSSGWTGYLDNEYRNYLRKAISGELTPKKALDEFAKDLSEKSGWKIKE
ncbi:MAG: sugar ABC transporter substrate-binding protein [Clostridiales bacterium]